MRRGVFAVLIFLLVSGCAATIPPHPLATDVVATLRVADVRVEYAPGARVSWPDYLFEMSQPLTGEASDKIVRDKVAERIVEAVRAEFAGRAGGQRLARVVVMVESVDLPAAIQRIVIGGSPRFEASAVIVDARTNAAIVTYPKALAVHFAGQGIAGTLIDRVATGQTSLADRVASSWSKAFANWLYAER